MKKVYVLMGGYSDTECVLGVFSSVKKVNDAIEWLIDNDAYYKNHPDRLYIDMFELNGERIENQTESKPYSIGGELSENTYKSRTLCDNIQP